MCKCIDQASQAESPLTKQCGNRFGQLHTQWVVENASESNKMDKEKSKVIARDLGDVIQRHLCHQTTCFVVKLALTKHGGADEGDAEKGWHSDLYSEWEDGEDKFDDYDY